MRRTGTVIGIVVVSAALALAIPGVVPASQEGKGMGPGMGMTSSSPCSYQMMGKGMMGMMHGTGSWTQGLSDADRGEVLVLKGRMMKKYSEVMKKQAEAMITEGKRLKKGEK